MRYIKPIDLDIFIPTAAVFGLALGLVRLILGRKEGRSFWLFITLASAAIIVCEYKLWDLVF